MGTFPKTNTQHKKTRAEFHHHQNAFHEIQSQQRNQKNTVRAVRKGGLLISAPIMLVAATFQMHFEGRKVKTREQTKQQQTYNSFIVRERAARDRVNRSSSLSRNSPASLRTSYLSKIRVQKRKNNTLLEIRRANAHD